MVSPLLEILHNVQNNLNFAKEEVICWRSVMKMDVPERSDDESKGIECLC